MTKEIKEVIKLELKKLSNSFNLKIELAEGLMNNLTEKFLDEDDYRLVRYVRQ